MRMARVVGAVRRPGTVLLVTPGSVVVSMSLAQATAVRQPLLDDLRLERLGQLRADGHAAARDAQIGGVQVQLDSCHKTY